MSNVFRKKSVHVAAVVLLLFIGVTQIFQGSWIFAKAILAQHLLEDAWGKTLTDKNIHRPWSWADTWPVARLKAPRLATDVIILSGDHGEALAFGPGHHSRSAMPGTAGTILIGGHRDTHFTFLKDLEIGDELSLQSQNGRWADYRITSTDIADARTDHVVASEFSSRLVLVTCWPFDALTTGGPLRYIVNAEPLERNVVTF